MMDLLRWKVSLVLVGENLNDAKSHFVKVGELGPVRRTDVRETVKSLRETQVEIKQ